MSAGSHRRDRLREQTVAEIKRTAREQLVDGGPTAVSLRAIARDMGMTAPALYRYFPALDALVMDLCTDLFTEIRLACEDAAADLPADQPVERIVAMARTMRAWVLEHRQEATLMLGPSLPGVGTFQGHCLDMQHAGARFAGMFLEPVMRLWHEGRLPPMDLVDLSPLQGALPSAPDTPPPVIAFFLTSWTRLYGIMVAELFNQLNWVNVDTSPLFELEVASFVSLVSGPPSGG